jgi:DnaJ-class molecular chaperone
LITPREAEKGTRKMINIAQEYQKKLFRLNVAPGTRDGTVLRLAGIGKKKGDRERGDVFLKVRIEP